MGRPKKEGAKKPGDLKEGQKRFTFIENEALVRGLAKREKLSINKLVKKAIAAYENKKTPRQKNEELLEMHAKKNGMTI